MILGLLLTVQKIPVEGIVHSSGMGLLQQQPLLSLAIVLMAGLFSGVIAMRLHLPSVTGQILVGVVLGPSVIGVFSPEILESFHPIINFALGLIAVAVGDHLNIRRLRNAYKRLLLLLVFEATVTPLLVLGGVMLMAPDRSLELGTLLAAMAISTAPATILALVKESRARGVFVKTLMAAVALNNMACICIFELAHIAARVTLDASVDHTMLEVLAAPFRQLALSAILGGCMGVLLVMATRHVVNPDRLAALSIITILMTSGLADARGISPLLSCMFLGMALANITPDKEEIGHNVFENFESAILAIFFTLAGMELNFDELARGGVLAFVLVATRLVGKITAGRIAMSLAGATQPLRDHLGAALVPQAGIAIGLVLLVQEDDALASVRDLLLAVGIASVTINEVIGPIMTRRAILRSGEAGKDREHLIDFLHEENIVTNLVAETKEEAIERLLDILISSHHLTVDRAEMLKSILEREQRGSTCIGGGLGIPHGVFEGGSAIVGVMGVSVRGLAFETPDEAPVHCMVLLATPPDMRDRHLQLLAALTRSVGSDINIQRQLYSATSPAHAFEILHAEEFEDFNYFLDDEAQGQL